MRICWIWWNRLETIFYPRWSSHRHPRWFILVLPFQNQMSRIWTDDLLSAISNKKGLSKKIIVQWKVHCTLTGPEWNSETRTSFFVRSTRVASIPYVSIWQRLYDTRWDAAADKAAESCPTLLIWTSVAYRNFVMKFRRYKKSRFHLEESSHWKPSSLFSANLRKYRLAKPWRGRHCLAITKLPAIHLPALFMENSENRKHEKM